MPSSASRTSSVARVVSNLARAAALGLVLQACDGGAPPAPTPAVATKTEAKQPAEACPSWAQLDPGTLPPLPASPYAATFEHVWRTVLEKHFDPTLGCQDWPARRLEFGEKLAAAKDATAAYAVMNELLG